MKFIKNITAFCLAFTVLAGCANAPDISSDYDQNYPFSNVKTYAWLENTGSNYTNLVGKRIINAADKALGDKGLILSDAGKADVIVTYNVSVSEEINVFEHYDSWGYSPYFGPRPMHHTTHVRKYNKGTLILDIIDNKKKTVIWRGSAQSTVKDNVSPEERTAKINQAISDMLASFPPH